MTVRERIIELQATIIITISNHRYSRDGGATEERLNIIADHADIQ